MRQMQAPGLLFEEMKGILFLKLRIRPQVRTHVCHSREGGNPDAVFVKAAKTLDAGSGQA